MATKHFCIQKVTDVVAVCTCPIGASINEIAACRQMFKSAMRDLHIDWDTVHEDKGASVIFKATKTNLEIVAC